MDNSYSSQDQVYVERSLLRSVYSWMALALFITAAVAWIVNPANNTWASSLYRGFTPIVLLVANFVLLIYLVRNVMEMKRNTALMYFLAYSAIQGVSLAPIFLIYTNTAIFSTFGIAGATFAVMSLYGYTTRKDLSSMGSYLFMGVIGLVIASLGNMLFRSSGFAMLINYAGVIIFTLLIAFKTQEIKKMARTVEEQNDHTFFSVSIVAALSLYLSFLNLFLFMLRIVGGGRN